MITTRLTQVRTIILHHDICISVYSSLKIGKYNRIPLGFPIYAEQTSKNCATEACKTTLTGQNSMSFPLMISTGVTCFPPQKKTINTSTTLFPPFHIWPVSFFVGAPFFLVAAAKRSGSTQGPGYSLHSLSVIHGVWISSSER